MNIAQQIDQCVQRARSMQGVVVIAGPTGAYIVTEQLRDDAVRLAQVDLLRCGGLSAIITPKRTSA
jgi:hypothetical protein